MRLIDGRWVWFRHIKWFQAWYGVFYPVEYLSVATTGQSAVRDTTAADALREIEKYPVGSVERSGILEAAAKKLRNRSG